MTQAGRCGVPGIAVRGSAAQSSLACIRRRQAAVFGQCWCSSEFGSRPSHCIQIRLDREPAWRPPSERASSASTRARRRSNRAAPAAATAGWRTSTASSSWRRRSRRTEERGYGLSAKRASKISRGRCGRGLRGRGDLGSRTRRRRVSNGLQRRAIWRDPSCAKASARRQSR